VHPLRAAISAWRFLRTRFDVKAIHWAQKTRTKIEKRKKYFAFAGLYIELYRFASRFEPLGTTLTQASPPLRLGCARRITKKLSSRSRRRPR
jgi:hypothetical protein